jgi:chromosome partitioning protein
VNREEYDRVSLGVLEQGRTSRSTVDLGAGDKSQNLLAGNFGVIRDRTVFVSAKSSHLQRIVILNPKGGCGKTTIATNLASYFALRGPLPALLDCDPQGASMRWLEKRDKNLPPIHGIAAYKSSMNATRSWQWRVPRETRRLIIDTPAALEGPEIHDAIYDANNILIPIMPSPIDIRFAAKFIAELLLIAQLDRGAIQLGIIANRTRNNTRSLQQLMRFLTSLKIPIIATLRDSQNYVAAADHGIGVYELPHHRARNDTAELAKIISWLDRWQAPRREPISTATTPEVPGEQIRRLQ